MDLKGKVAIITGGSSGIGLSIALEFARQKANLVIDHYKQSDAANSLLKQIQDLKAEAIAVEANVADLKDLQMLMDKTVARFGKIDVLINNAGIETRTSILDTTEMQYDKVLSVNLKGAFFATQFAAHQMIKQKSGGKIINLSSVHEDWPMPGNNPYCLSKGGVRMLTRTAALELAKHNIQVMSIGPGAVATPINLSTMNDPELMKKLNDAIPLGRMAKPEEIAKLAAFLASDQNSYITGSTIFIDGGMMHQSPGL